MCCIFRIWPAYLLTFFFLLPFSTHLYAQNNIGTQYTDLEYYRLRMEFTTTSDRAAFDFDSGDNMLTGWQVKVGGTPSECTVRKNRLILIQPASSARLGRAVSITADVVVSPGILREPLVYNLREAQKNSSRVQISLVNGDGSIQPLLDIDKGGKDSVDLGRLISASSSSLTLPVIEHKKMLWAFYYPWYIKKRWSGPDINDRPIEDYFSGDVSTIEKHIDQAKNVGIDGFICSWWGPGDFTDENFKKILRIAEAKQFKICIYYELITGSLRPRKSEETYDWLKTIISQYGQASAYMKLQGKPLIFLWQSNQVPLYEWETIINDLRRQGLDASYIGFGFDEENLTLFEGFHYYTAIDDLPTLQSASRAAYYYPLKALKDGDAERVRSATPKLFAATVQPGYDERLLPDRMGRYTDRDNGKYYQFTWNKAIASNPDWILITSWNEFPENTHIEPSRQYGDKYLKMTREFAELWRSTP